LRSATVTHLRPRFDARGQPTVGAAEAFFGDWFVLNDCALVFLEASGRDFTPDKRPTAERRDVPEASDRHLAGALRALGLTSPGRA
jgi:hypothetical protein